MTGANDRHGRPVSEPPRPDDSLAGSDAKRPSGLPGVLTDFSGEAGYDILVGFLESDLQGGIAGVERLLADMDRVECGEAGTVERCGNAYRLQLQRDVAVLQSLHDPEQADGCIDMRLLRRALIAWRAALQQP